MPLHKMQNGILAKSHQNYRKVRQEGIVYIGSTLRCGVSNKLHVCKLTINTSLESGSALLAK